MILVFGAFMLGGLRVIELFGFGLAGAVLLDAVIVRSVLVPALMLVCGKAAWWLPRSVDRVLPSLNVEGSVQEHVPAATERVDPRPVVVDSPIPDAGS
jgi:RND superfamily putative drug exporter